MFPSKSGWWNHGRNTSAVNPSGHTDISVSSCTTCSFLHRRTVSQLQDCSYEVHLQCHYDIGRSIWSFDILEIGGRLTKCSSFGYEHVQRWAPVRQLSAFNLWCLNGYWFRAYLKQISNLTKSAVHLNLAWPWCPLLLWLSLCFSPLTGEGVIRMRKDMDDRHGEVL